MPASDPQAEPAPLPDGYAEALETASTLLALSPEMEIRSALKEAGRTHGLPVGRKLATFVTWAEKELSA